MKFNVKNKRATLNSLDKLTNYKSKHHIGNFEISINKKYN